MGWWTSKGVPKAISSNSTRHYLAAVPGDLDVTIDWRPDTELRLVHIDNEINSRALINGGENSSVRVIPAADNWSGKDVKTMLKDG